jgi:hypothetical protein
LAVKHRRLQADDLDVLLHVLGGGRHAGDQPAAADRDRQHLEIRHVLQHLQRHRALAGHDVEIIERMHEGQAPLLAEPVGRGRGLVIAVAVDHHLGAVGAGLLHLHERCGLGHHDGHRDAQAGGVIGQTLAMIAGRGGDHAAGAHGLIQEQQFVERPALLVGGGELQVLELHPHLGAGDLAQRPRPTAGRALDVSAQPFLGREDIVKGERHGMRTGARKGAQPNGGPVLPQCEVQGAAIAAQFSPGLSHRQRGFVVPERSRRGAQRLRLGGASSKPGASSGLT